MRKITVMLILLLSCFCLSTKCFAAPKGAVLIDKDNGRVFFEVDKDKKLPMASTTKIMTALIVLEEEDIDSCFKVNKTAVFVEGSSMGLLDGDTVTLRNLAVGMLLASGNDAANAAAVKISGSTEKFVSLMNKRAAEMGLKNTSFETPSGLDGENHFSTAYDMAILAKNALQNPDFAKICASESMRIEYGNPPYLRNIKNHNRLLKTLEGATGVKTGFTKKSGRCLVSSAEREGVSLICVTLNCSDDWNYHTALYNEYFSKLSSVSLKKFVPKIELPVCSGSSKTVILSPEDVFASLFEGETERVDVIVSKPPFVFAPIEKGDMLGKVYFYINGELIAETPLVAENKVETLPENDDFWDKIKDIF